MLVGTIIALLLITVNVNFIRGDSILKDIRFKNLIRQEVLKEWTVYIDEYLELLIPLALSYDTNIENFLLVQNQNVVNFAQHSKSVFLHFNFDLVISKIKRASGKLFIHSKNKELDARTYYEMARNMDENINVIFIMDKRLSLNLTFDTLFFASGYHDCHLGNLSVFELVYLGASKIAHLSHSFCGYHSEFSLYPEQSSLVVSVSVRLNIFFVLDATFSVMDSNLVKSFHKSNCSYKCPFSSIYIFSSWMVSFYLVQVKKTHKIRLKFPQKYFTWHLVYDGPGLMSDILNANMNSNPKAHIYSCSSFQCLAKILTNHVEIFLLNYSSVQLPVMLRKEIQSTGYFTIHGTQCTTVPCLVLLFAPYDFQVNVTILTISYKSISVELPNSGCRYGGLIFAEEFNHEYLENVPFCKNHNSSEDVSRSYYSRNSTLTMVLYTYDKYSAINVALELSLTKCKPINLNFYELLTFCPDFNQSEKHCPTYLRQMTEGTSLSFSLGSDHSIFFSISKQECVVLLLDMRFTHEFSSIEKRQTKFDFIREPVFTLSSESIHTFGVEMNYRITGTFVPRFLSKYVHSERIYFRSVSETEHFCSWKFNAHERTWSWKCRSNKLSRRVKCGHSPNCGDYNEAIMASKFRAPVIVSASTKSPLKLMKFRMEFTFYQHSES